MPKFITMSFFFMLAYIGVSLLEPHNNFDGVTILVAAFFFGAWLQDMDVA